MKKSFNIIITFILLSLSSHWLNAQDNTIDNVIEYRVDAELRYKSDKLKKTSFYLDESFRFNDDFEADKLLVGLKLKQKVAPFLSLSARYRMAFLLDDNDIENLFDLSAVINKDFNRLETRFRIRYTNNADEWNYEGFQYVRMRALGRYNVPSCKLTPSLSFELFQHTGISSFHQYRTSVGIERKIAQRQYIEFSYKYDYYLDDYKNKHIFALNYNYKL